MPLMRHTAATVTSVAAALAAGLALAGGALAAPARSAAPAASAATSAGASVVQLGWVEKMNRDAQTRLVFRFRTLTTTAKSWSATVEVTNTGTGAIAVQRTQFGLAEFDAATNYSQPTRVLRATALLPAPPARLAPGATWKGTLSGTGKPDERLYVRVVLGPFASSTSPQGFSWISDHARHVFTISI